MWPRTPDVGLRAADVGLPGVKWCAACWCAWGCGAGGSAGLWLYLGGGCKREDGGGAPAEAAQEGGGGAAAAVNPLQRLHRAGYPGGWHRPPGHGSSGGANGVPLPPAGLGLGASSATPLPAEPLAPPVTSSLPWSVYSCRPARGRCQPSPPRSGTARQRLRGRPLGFAVEQSAARLLAFERRWCGGGLWTADQLKAYLRSLPPECSPVETGGHPAVRIRRE